LDQLVNKWPDTIPGAIALAMALVIVAMAGAVAFIFRAYVKARDEKDTQGKEFLQMFAEAQSDAFAQIKESDKTMGALVAALTAVKDQGVRLEAQLRHIEDHMGQ
jgi:hypothetical protein